MITKAKLEKTMQEAEEKLLEIGIDEARTEVELILEYLLKIERL